MSEGRELLEEKIRYLQHRNQFMNFLVSNEATRVAETPGDHGDATEVARAMFIDAVEQGFEQGVFRPDGEMIISGDVPELLKAAFQEAWEKAIPWGVIKVVAEEFGVDVERFDAIISAARENSKRVIKMPENSAVDLDRSLSEDAWVKHTEGKYVLHCAHDGHPCDHSYPDLQMAISVAVAEMQNGGLEAVGAITKDGVEVVSAVEMSQRVEQAKNARYN